MIKTLFVSYVLPLFLAGTGYIMPENKLYIGCIFYASAVLIFCYSLFKHYRTKKSIIKNNQKITKHNIINNCVQDERAGWFRHPKTDEIFCLKCWYEKNTITPLIKDVEVPAGWICPRCKKTYISLSRMFMNSLIVRYFIASAKQQPKKKSVFNRK